MNKERREIMKYIIMTALVAILASCSTKQKQETDEVGQNVVVTEAPNDTLRGSDRGDIEGLSSLYFDFDQSGLAESETQRMQENVKWFKANEQKKVTIEGHCDERGSNEYNLALGERRALSVKQMLESQGIDGRRISIVSFGEERPKAPNETEEGQAKNRRVNFVPVTE
jgi:peptidoglycan-associated lipoprotein